MAKDKSVDKRGPRNESLKNCKNEENLQRRGKIGRRKTR